MGGRVAALHFVSKTACISENININRKHKHSKEANMSLIAIQEHYIDRIISASQRWSHRKDGGHSRRSKRAACREASEALTKMGFSAEQTKLAIKDADDMAALKLAAE